MIFFNLQSLILIALAYFLGAFLGCWLRKMFKDSASILHSGRGDLAMAGAGAAAATAASAATRYAGREGEASIKISRPEAVREIPEEIQVETRREAVIPAVVEIAREEPQPERETFQYVEPEPVIEPVIVPEPVVVPAAIVKEDVIYETPEPVAEPVIDDLTKIKGVGLPIALEMKRIGVTRFAQIARWTDRDIAAVSSKLGFSGRIERENWMAQAKILASGDGLEFTNHQLRGTERTSRGTERQSRTRPDGRDRSRQLKGDRAFTLTSHETKDDLKLISGIGATLEQKLNELGIDHFAEIAAWTPDDVAAVSRRLELEDLIERDDWIDQARKLVMLNS